MLTVQHLNLFMLMVLVLLVAYPMFAPIVPAKYSKLSVQNPHNIHSGKTLTYKMNVCRYVSEGVLTTVTRQLVSVSDKTLNPINLGSDTFTNSARCMDYKKTVIVPYSTPEGKYRLLIKGVYSVIPLRKPITVSAKSDTFNVKVSNAEQDIEALIEANSRLQEQIKAQVDGSRYSPTVVPNSGDNNTSSEAVRVQNNINNSSKQENKEDKKEKEEEKPAQNSGLLPSLLGILGLN